MKLTYAQMFSFSETVAEILTQNKKIFTDAGLDVDKKWKEIIAKNKIAIQDDAKQEAMKAELVKATKKAVASVNDCYKFASSTLDAMVGTLGKNEPLSKRLRQLRDQMSQEPLKTKEKTQ